MDRLLFIENLSEFAEKANFFCKKILDKNCII